MKDQPLGNNITQTEKSTCSSCCSPGLCPGTTLLLAYLTGIGISLMTGIQWLGWVVGIATAIILVTGAWRFLRKATSPVAADPIE